MNNNKYKRTIGAFSLLEIMVSMAIIGIIMAMLSNVLVNSILISQKSIARSFVREELSDIVDRIASDIRDANTVNGCSGSLQTAKCDLVLDVPVTWKTCVNGTGGNYDVCKVDANGNVLFSSSPSIKLKNFTFDQGFDTGTNTIRKNVLITIVADHVNTATGVTNILRQTSVSTRNYELINPGTLVGGSPIIGVNTFGTGSDGSLNFTGNFNINTNSSGSRTFADGIAYRVVAPAVGATSVTRFATNYALNNGITAGDSVLLINMQGTAADFAAAGNYELKTVQAVAADTVTFTSAVQKNFVGTSAANQKVIIQRVPNYTDVTLDNGDTLTAGAWGRLAAGITPPAGIARTFHNGFYIGGKIYYIFGCSSTSCGYLTSTNIYDLDSNSWTTGAAAPVGRYGTDPVYYNGQIYAWSGVSTTYVNTVAIYDVNNNTWGTGTAGGTARRYFKSALYNAKMYAWGGQISNGTIVNTMDIYDIPSGTWTTGPVGGTARYLYSSAVYNGKWYIWGGCNAGCTTYYNTVDIFDLTTNTWSTGAAGGTARIDTDSVLYNGKIYFFHGYSAGPTLRNIVDIYDIGSNSWSTGTAGGTARAFPTATLVDNQVYLYGGNVLAGTAYATTDIYDLDSGQWNAFRGFPTGIVAFKASGNVDVKTGGKISANGLGFYPSGTNWPGESYAGTGAYNMNAANKGGGGAGYQFSGCTYSGGGGGGGYGANGGAGGQYFCSGIGTSAGGNGGVAYGSSDLSTLFLGSGGGTGVGAGGRGGGMILIFARNVSLSGTISANGNNGGASATNGGGGGGSGGSIYIGTINANIGTSLITSTAGTGGTGYPGSNPGRGGGVGRIAIYYNSSLTGTSSPAAYTQLFTPN
jgi:prepilin-type N-terminal cleavage/methylation domain-containing protein